MPDWPLWGAQRYESAGAVAASSIGTTVGIGATNVKGSWVQLIASTSFEVTGIIVHPTMAGGSTDVLIDIGIGAAAAEVVVIENLYTGTAAAATSQGAWYYVPICIPMGTRIAARAQGVAASTSPRVNLTLIGQGFDPSQPLGICTTYGAATADSGGTSVDPGGTLNTKGAWSQITASTTYGISALLIAFPNQVNTTRTGCTWLVDIGIGAASSEIVLIPDLLLYASTAVDVVIPQSFGPIPCSIPAGTRLAVRAQCSIIDATDRLFDAIIYGVS
jgi:hypothetical protein